MPTLEPIHRNTNEVQTPSLSRILLRVFIFGIFVLALGLLFLVVGFRTDPNYIFIWAGIGIAGICWTMLKLLNKRSKTQAVYQPMVQATNPLQQSESTFSQVPQDAESSSGAARQTSTQNVLNDATIVTIGIILGGIMALPLGIGFSGGFTLGIVGGAAAEAYCLLRRQSTRKENQEDSAYQGPRCSSCGKPIQPNTKICPSCNWTQPM
jgi:hypothetical protein